MSSTKALRELTRVRFLRFIREKESVFWVFVFPILLAVVLGVAFKNRGVTAVDVGVLDGPGADRVVEALEAAAHIDVERFATPEEAQQQLKKGAIAALVTPGDPIGFRFDPTRPDGELARLRVEDALQRAAGRVDPVSLEREEVTETGSRYIDFLLPGILGMNLMGTGIWGIGFGIVTDRQRKLLKRLLVTPMRRWAFLLSFLLSRLLFMILEVAVIVAFAVWVLDVPLRGSLVSFSLIALVGTLAFTAMGVLLASRTETIEGISGLTNAATLPMWLCCGVFFSWERFPEIVHPLIQALPLTAFNDALRANMLDGASLWSQLPQIGVLGAWGLGCFGLALKIFRWQ